MLRLTLLMFFFSIHAIADEYKNYVVSDMTVRLPAKVVSESSSTLKKMSESIKLCEPNELSFKSPLIKREYSVKITPAKSGCRVTVFNYGIWQYQCILNESDRIKFSKGMDSRLSGALVFGDHSEQESSILFNNSKCDEYKM